MTVRLKLLRDNDDPVLLADLDRLAGREPAGVTAPEDAVDAGEEAHVPGPLDDPFVRGFVQVSVHLRRFAPFYAGAGAWLAVMLLIQPLGGDRRDAGPTELAGATARRATSAPAALATGRAPTGAEAFEAVTDRSFSTSATFGGVTFGGSDFSEDSPSDAAAEGTTVTAPDDLTFEDFDDAEFEETAEEVTIVRSGYASSTGGTPAEREPPNGGLPVAAAAGNDTKRSFLGLAGGGSELRLRQVPGAVPLPATAAVKACALATGDWAAERGQPLADSPPLEFTCSTGQVQDGIWTFDLGSFLPEELARGLALTPAAGTALTFEVVFEPVALPSSSTDDG